MLGTLEFFSTFQVSGTIFSCFHSSKIMTTDLELFSYKIFPLYSQSTDDHVAKWATVHLNSKEGLSGHHRDGYLHFYVEHKAGQLTALELSHHLWLDSKTYLEAYAVDPELPTQ